MSEEEVKTAKESPSAEDATSTEEALTAKPEKVEEVKAEPKEEEVKEDKKEEEAPPEKYELKLSEDSLLDSSVVERIAAEAKERGLSQDDAQKLLDRENSAVTSYQKLQEEEYKQRSGAWVDEIKSDKELGGEAFNENAELAKRVTQRFGSEAFLKTLDETGLGNHPELVRTFVRIGKSMKDDQLVLPGAQPAPKKTHAEILYPSKE